MSLLKLSVPKCCMLMDVCPDMLVLSYIGFCNKGSAQAFCPSALCASYGLQDHVREHTASHHQRVLVQMCIQ